MKKKGYRVKKSNKEILDSLKDSLENFVLKTGDIIRIIFIDYIIITILATTLLWATYYFLDRHFNTKVIRVKVHLYEGSIDYAHVSKRIRTNSFSNRFEDYYYNEIQPYVPVTFYQIELILELYLFEYFLYPDEYRANIGGHYNKLIEMERNDRRERREKIENAAN